jgi:cytochrome c553
VIRLRHLFAAVALLLAVTVITVGGLIPIQASSGHWRATAWVLDFIKRRSVHTYSRNIALPGDAMRSWVARGASHYESGCRPCHGSPISPRPPMVMRMTPHPPELPQRMARWDDRELFQIVKHGIKFTAMPAWAAPQRADEIWAMVTFLRALPRLTPESYRDLAFGGTTTADGVSAVERCARCHGSDGMGRDGRFPILAAQREAYMANALAAFRDGRRHSGFMRPEAAELDATVRDGVLAYFARLPRAASSRPPVQGGADLIFSGVPASQIPACSQCHGPGATEHNPGYPVLAGQDADYLFEQLILFSENRRGGSEYAPIMQAIASRLSRDQMRAAADHFSTLSP